MKEEVQLFDLKRMFLGDLPPVFILEIVFRAVFMYAFTVILLRILGKRAMGQFSMLEVAIIIALGSAAGEPMINTQMPLLYGMVVITVVVLFQLGLERFINKNPRIEAIMEGEANLVVDEGVIRWDCMQKDNMSREDLFRSLRTQEVEQLGQVRKAFFETSGSISIQFQSPRKVKPGLSVLPPSELDMERLFRQGDRVPAGSNYSCCNCGNTLQLDQSAQFHYCPSCGQDTWIESVI